MGHTYDRDLADVFAIQSEIAKTIMAAFGQPHPDYYTATDLSRDGNSVLVVGNPPLIDAQSTPDLILDLVWPGQTVTP